MAKSQRTNRKNAAARRLLHDFLSDRRSYPHLPRSVRIIETHSAVIYLAGSLVYKVKKPVNLGFLDFSSLSKRRHFCHREVELNRRLCEGVYLGVVEIKRGRDGRLRFGGPGRTIECAVKMKRLSERFFLHRLLARDAVDREDIDRVVGALRDFYLAQHPTKEIEAWGRIAKLRISTDENFRQTEPFLGRTLTAAVWTALRQYTDGFYRTRRALFAARVRDRWIRDCHGDLHLEHIHLTPKSLHIYDCIEFNDRLRYVDVANDAAFLSMDLDHRGRPDLSRYFVQKMARALRDSAMLELMDFYKAYRAFVRGKVESLQSQSGGPEDDRSRDHRERASRYFRQALRYAVAGSRPLVVAVMGGVASGKSTLAEALGNELGWKVYSSDKLRKQGAGMKLDRRTPPERRAWLYSRPQTQRTYRSLLSLAVAEIREGRGVVLDATFSRRVLRRQLLRRVGAGDGRVVFLEVHVSASEARKRLRARQAEDATVISDARLEDFAKLNAHYEPPTELPPSEWIPIQSSGKPSHVLKAVLRRLVQRAREVEVPRPRRS